MTIFLHFNIKVKSEIQNVNKTKGQVNISRLEGWIG